MTGRILPYIFYVYILLLNNGDLYTGFTGDLRRRVSEHINGTVESTKGKFVKLIHYEAYFLESDARRREEYLKTTEGKRFRRQQLKDLIISIERGEVA